MPPEKILSTTVIPWDKFWKWLQGHPNCILEAGTAEAVLFDDEDFHWHFAADDEGKPLVQVIRGKQLVGEIAIFPQQVAYVEVEQKSEDEFIFECIVEADSDRVSAYHFALSHGYDASEPEKQGRWVH